MRVHRAGISSLAFFAIVIGVWHSTPSWSGQAETPIPAVNTSVVLQNQIFTQDDISTAFIETAFSSYILPNTYPAEPYLPNLTCSKITNADDENLSRLNNDFNLARGNISIKNSPDGISIINPIIEVQDLCVDGTIFEQQYPWISEYIRRDKGYPRFYAVNKWTAPPKISLGYPRDLMPRTDDNSEQAVFLTDVGVSATHHTASARDREPDANMRQVANVAIEEIKAALPVIRQETGLNVSFISHDNEKSDDEANIRIVIVDHPMDWATPYKSAHVAPSGAPKNITVITGDRPYADPRVIEFGDLIKNISTAVRFTPVAEQQVDGFLLPNADNSIGMAFCFVNIKAPPDLVKPLIRECILRSMGLPSAASRTKPSSVLSLWHEPTGLSPANRWKPVVPEITDYDRHILRMLYDPRIKPGMSPVEARNALLKNQK